MTVNGALDYEVATSHSITVRATSTDTSSATLAVTINLVDQNDVTPVITPGQGFGIDENSANGTSVGTVLATDPDTIGTVAGWAITAGDPLGAFAFVQPGPALLSGGP